MRLVEKTAMRVVAKKSTLSFVVGLVSVAVMFILATGTLYFAWRDQPKTILGIVSPTGLIAFLIGSFFLIYGGYTTLTNGKVRVLADKKTHQLEINRVSFLKSMKVCVPFASVKRIVLQKYVSPMIGDNGRSEDFLLKADCENGKSHPIYNSQTDDPGFAIMLSVNQEKLREIGKALADIMGVPFEEKNRGYNWISNYQ